MAQFVQTHHGGKALLYEGYKYSKIRDGKECTFWRCERHKANAQQGATQPPRKKRYIQRDEKIQKLFERFQNGESSLAEYLACSETPNWTLVIEQCSTVKTKLLF